VRSAGAAVFLLAACSSTAQAAAATSCGFDRDALTFAGPPLVQARCLLRHVLPGGELDPPLAALPAPLEDLVDRPVAIPAASLARYLAAHGISELEVGGSLAEPLSRARDNAPDAPLARYFVIHDTSEPNLCEAASFPPELDQPDGPWNRNEMYANFPQAHLFITRDGRSIAPQGRTFKIPWRATKLERPAADKRTKGLFLHIENVQPRRAEPEPDFPHGDTPDRRFYAWDFLEAGWVCRNDRIAPEPGLTDAQLDRLALVYVAASVRRGSWLIPAFHATVDAGIPEAHDDPQNFDLARWAARLGRLIGELTAAPAAVGSMARIR
jgi:hypothetical protein